MNYKTYKVLELLKAYDLILEELRARKIVRSSNPPAGDYAEHLVCKVLNLKQSSNSKTGYDAVDDKGLRYQIKGRRITNHNNSRQLSALRNLKEKHFDFLVGVIFNADFTVLKAIKIPHHLIEGDFTRFSEHVNASIFSLHDDIWKLEGVEDLTEATRAAQIGMT